MGRGAFSWGVFVLEALFLWLLTRPLRLFCSARHHLRIGIEVVFYRPVRASTNAISNSSLFESRTADASTCAHAAAVIAERCGDTL